MMASAKFVAPCAVPQHLPMLIDAWRPIWLGSAVETGGNPDFTADVDTGHSTEIHSASADSAQQIPTDSNSVSERLSFFPAKLT